MERNQVIWLFFCIWIYVFVHVDGFHGGLLRKISSERIEKSVELSLPPILSSSSSSSSSSLLFSPTKFHGFPTLLFAGKKAENQKSSTKGGEKSKSIPLPIEEEQEEGEGEAIDLITFKNMVYGENNEDATDSEEDHEEGVLSYKDFVVAADEKHYREYFDSVATTDPTTGNLTISFEAFQNYPRLQEELIKTKKIAPQDIEDTWSQVLGDDHPKPTTFPFPYEDSIEVLFMLYDFPDIDKEFSFRETFEELLTSKENIKQLKTIGLSAKDLTLSSIVIDEENSTPSIDGIGKKKHVQYGLLSWNAFLKWDEIQEILADEVFSKEELINLWKITKEAKVLNTKNPFLASIGSTIETDEKKKTTKKSSGTIATVRANDFIDVEEFLYLNRLIDEILDERELDEEESKLKKLSGGDWGDDLEDDEEDDGEETDDDELLDEDDDVEYIDEVNIDWDNLWTTSFDFSPVYDEETIQELKEEYIAIASSGKKKNAKSAKVVTDDASLPLLSLEKFLKWKDVKEILSEELLTKEEITEVWKEALKYRAEFIIPSAIVVAEDAPPLKRVSKLKTTKGKESAESKASTTETEETPVTINFDLFLRVNAKLEYLIAQKEEEEYSDDEEADEEDASEFYREQFTELTQNGKKTTVSLNDLLQWREIQELIEDNVLSEKQIKQLYDTLPKVGKGTAAGITVDSFIMLNNMIDVLIDTKETEKEEEDEKGTGKVGKTVNNKGEGTKKGTVVGTAPTALLESNTYRLPTKDQELKPLFSSDKSLSSSFFLDDENSANVGMLDEIEQRLKSTLSAPTSTTATTTSTTKNTKLSAEEKGQLSEEDYEMLTILDQADTLLNTGSFTSFDQLIGDTDDERLGTIKSIESERQTLKNVPGAKSLVVEDIVNRLLALGNTQKRCGIESKKQYEQSRTPKESSSSSTSSSSANDGKDYEAVDREFQYLIQLLIDNTPKLSASKTIQQIQRLLNGSWKVLFTNSDMFYFYNGLSGFVNILPGSQLSSINIDFQSDDGYLSETKIEETVINTLLPNKPTFPITITGTFEIVKEISFMTNELSILFRHYPKEVTVANLKYQAEDTWKSLRSIALNEILYIDEKCIIFRNAGALRIFFILQRI